MLPERARQQRQPWDLVPSADAKWTKHGGTRQPCTECVLRRHHGNTTAHPNSARYRRTLGDQVWFGCNDHAMARRENDNDAKTARKLAAGGRRTR